jgi:transcriptional regulator with XRE-family HTH domain
LLNARKARRRYQLELACAACAIDPDCGIHQVRISDWEHGKAHPSLRQFRILCHALRLTPAEQADGQSLWDAAELVWQHGRGAVVEQQRFTDREASAVLRAFWGSP